MKIFFFAIISFLSAAVSAQTLFHNLEPVRGELTDEPATMVTLTEPGRTDGQVPPPPVLTSGSQELEICTGMSTTLSASSDHLIDWYTTPPPLGTPVGRGPIFVTPTLTTGYYTFYAIATDGHSNSNVSAMEVVMVYPYPTVTVTSSADVICAGGSVVLTARGTSFYDWGNDAHTPSIVISPGVTTTYVVTGTSMAGCKSSFSFTQRVENCTAIEEKSAEPKRSDNLVSVYPNPNNGEFNITLSSLSENTRAVAYNALGELVYSVKIKTEHTPVTLKHLPDGIYNVVIMEHNNILAHRKIVKQ